MSSAPNLRRLRPVAGAPYPELDRSPDSIRSDLRAGRYRAYRVRGRRGLYFDLDEARTSLARLSRATVRLGYGKLGPNATVVHVSSVESTP